MGLRHWWRRFVREYVIDDDPTEWEPLPPVRPAETDYWKRSEFPLLDIEMPPGDAICVRCGDELEADDPGARPFPGESVLCRECRDWLRNWAQNRMA